MTVSGKRSAKPRKEGRYDVKFPSSERLPTRFRVEFIETRVGGSGVRIELLCGGKPLGDPLTDNAHTDDGYRYHDVFHLTNAILLGWSPVTRKLLGVKRKSVPQIDEVEDGARAAVIEEAVSALTFGYAKDFSFFQGSNSVEYGLLRTIQMMTRPFEVRDRTSREWEHAILSGYQVWRKMRIHRGGIFVGDRVAGSVRYERGQRRSRRPR
jgi:hypothetical protein